MKVLDQQLDLPLLCRLDGPSVVPDSHVRACQTYRDAVRLCWALRRVKKMTSLTLAEQAGFPANHRSDYLCSLFGESAYSGEPRERDWQKGAGAALAWESA